MDKWSRGTELGVLDYRLVLGRFVKTHLRPDVILDKLVLEKGAAGSERGRVASVTTHLMVFVLV